MKKLLIICPLFVLAFYSCHKKYDEKTGSFTGIQVYFEGSYDQVDTFQYDLSSAIFTLNYDKKQKEYLLSSNTSEFPNISIPREELKDNEASGTGVWTSVSNWDINLEGNDINATYSILDQNVYKLVNFEGERN